MVRLSQAGMGFLKCAFAPPDFNSDPGLGIPDDFMGKTLCRKDVINSSVGFTAAKDTFLVIMPTPGIAYWKVEVPFGTFPLITDTLVAFPYQGFNNMFPASSALIANRSSNVNQFRYASMCVGLYPTSNLTQYGGSITVWKMPLDLSSALVNDTVAGTSRMTSLSTVWLDYRLSAPTTMLLRLSKGAIRSLPAANLTLPSVTYLKEFKLSQR